MKFFTTALLVSLICLSLACGYSHKTTPAMAGTMPTITQLSPSMMTHGAAQFTMTVNGTNYNGNAVVNWNNTTLTTAWVSGGQLTAMVPAANVASMGSVQVTVTNPGTPGGPYGGGTQSETSAAMTFTIN